MLLRATFVARLCKETMMMRKQNEQLHLKWQRSILFIFLSIAIVFILLLQLDHKIRPCIQSVCQAETNRYASHLMETSIQQVISEQNYSYSDFATLLYDENGTMIGVESLTQNINQIQISLLQAINQNLTADHAKTIPISIGSATGIWLFAEKGPSIPIRLMPIGDASVKLISSLKSAGINQTCHTIQVKVTANIATAIPFHQTKTKISYTYLLAETVIVGTVPEAYLEFGE